MGFHQIYNLLPEGLPEFNFQGRTLLELVNELIERNGVQFKESFWDSRLEALDPTIQIMINNRLIPKDKIPEEIIKDGDIVTFMKLLAGG